MRAAASRCGGESRESVLLTSIPGAFGIALLRSSSPRHRPVRTSPRPRRLARGGRSTAHYVLADGSALDTALIASSLCVCRLATAVASACIDAWRMKSAPATNQTSSPPAGRITM